MPQAVFKSIYAVSSEDPVHQATSLLKIQSGKKWKTRSPGEKSAYVILQLAKSRKITGIDIGNEHSAFIEVLVGKNSCSQDDFKEILITCSFMTPIESKNSSNLNRVRCFAKNALVESIAEEKWDLVKVICTQPFNKHVQYGLSFITLHIEEEKENKTVSKPLVPAKYVPKAAEDKDSKNDSLSFIGKFKLREDSPDSETENTTSLFKRWKQTKDHSSSSTATKNLSAAAAIRDASNPCSLKEQSESLKPTRLLKKTDGERSDNKQKIEDKKILDRNRNDLLFDKEDDIPNDKLERRISEDQERINKQKKESEKPEKTEKQDKPRSTEKTDKNKTVITQKPTPSRHLDPKGNSRKRSLSPKANAAKKLKPDKETKYKPFDKLLQGVVLAISGIQNPDRANLRRKALELGAKYKPDWDDTCTHLICAFKNTPKYNQVKGKGKIVTKSWIERCFSLKKRLPWRRFAMEDRELEKSESEDEIHDISLKPKDSSQSPTPLSKQNSPLSARKSPTSESLSDCHEKETPKRKKSLEDTLAYYDENKTRNVLSSGSDTEEEIDRITRNNKMVQSHKNGDKSTVYDLTTEEEEYTKSLELETEDSAPDFFKNNKFFVSGKLGSVDQIKLKQYISKHGGEVVNAIVDSDYAITDTVISTPSGFNGETVKPLWIYECNDMECLIPTKRYKV